MLDSSPIPAPPRKKLKRSASLASLPSPPPSIQQPRKRRNLGQTGSDIDSASDQEEAIVAEGDILGRKLLFPPSLSTGSSKPTNPDDPFVVGGAADIGEQSPVEPESFSSKQRICPTSPPPSKGKVSKSAPKSPRTPPPKTPPPKEKPSTRQSAISDDEENPFLGDMPPPSRRAKSPLDITQRPTMTYVFKGVKTIVPNPFYGLSESDFERSRLPLSHPDYSPPPVVKPKFLFPEAYKKGNVGKGGNDREERDFEDEGEDSSQSEPRTPENKPKSRMSKVFVDAQGNPLPDSGPEGIRGSIMDAEEVGRMAVGPIRKRC